jgi:ectoine hydroxylase-related dioxygenase (phytanoyl-CoA dioxygenase family)
MATIKAPEVDAAVLFDERAGEAAVEAYQRVGAIIVRRLISEDWIAAVRRVYDGLAASAVVPFIKGEPPPDMRKLIQRPGSSEESAEFRDFLFNSPIGRAAARCMRSKTAQLYEDILITEPPGGRAQLSWHQDEPTWPVMGRQLSSVWFSLEPVEAETGAMRFVQGTHLGPMYHPAYVTAEQAGADARFWEGPMPEVDAASDTFTIAMTDAAPGDAIIFHPRAIHSSYGSSKDYARRTFTIRLIGDDVRWCDKKRIYHRWMHDLGLKEGDKIVSPRLPVVWDAERVVAQA